MSKARATKAVHEAVKSARMSAAVALLVLARMESKK
jgi:hypothetical protein